MSRQKARGIAEAVTLAAGEAGTAIPEYLAQRIADAACAWYDGVLSKREVAARPRWQDPGFRDYLRQRMRHDLLDIITRQGYVPVSLPSETVRYVTGGLLDPDHRHEVPESGNWQEVVLALEVGVRRPRIDRAAAVRVGVLGGGAPPPAAIARHE